MPISFSSKSLTLDDFQKFSEQATTSDKAVIGKKFFGSGFKQIFSFSLQKQFGGTSSIVTDFKKALEEKYGKEIAGFVFSPDDEKIALSQGLSREKINIVLKKAETVSSASFKDEFLAYHTAIHDKQKLVENKIQQLSSPRELSNVKKKYAQIKEAWDDCADVFDSWHSNNSEETTQKLREYFQEKLKFIDNIAREVIEDPIKTLQSNSLLQSHEVEDTTQVSVEGPNPSLPLIEEAVVSKATGILQKTLKITPQEAEKSIRLLEAALGKKASDELMERLSDHQQFITPIDQMVEEMAIAEHETREILIRKPASNINPPRDDVSSSIRRDIDTSPELQKLYAEHPELQPFLENLSRLPDILKRDTDRLQEQLQPFFSALKTSTANRESYFYLDDASQTVAIHGPQIKSSKVPSLDEQSAAARRFFDALKGFYGAALIDTLVPAEGQTQPLNLQQAREVLHKIDETIEQISKFLKENPLIIIPEHILSLFHDQEVAAATQQSHQQLGESGNALLSTLREMGICGMILSGTKIGLGLAGVCTPALPCIALAIGAAAIDGYIVGRFITKEEGLSEEAQHKAATISAASTTGSAAGLIASRLLLQPFIGTYIPEPVSSTAAEYAGSFIGLSLEEAARGGARTAQQHDPKNEEDRLPEDYVFLESRLIHFLGLQSYIDSLSSSIANLGSLLPAPSNTSTGSSVSTELRRRPLI